MIANQKITVIGLFLVFFVPLLIAAALYFGQPQIEALSPKPHGQLITPVQTLQPLSVSASEATALNKDLLRNKWTFLYWNTAHCDLYCEAALFKMRQVRLSLGKYIGRTQMVYLTPDLKVVNIGALKQKHPKLIFAQSKGANAMLVEQMQQYPSGHIYVVDSFGNLVMQYADAANSKGILRDMKKLLSVSRNG